MGQALVVYDVKQATVDLGQLVILHIEVIGGFKEAFGLTLQLVPLRFQFLCLDFQCVVLALRQVVLILDAITVLCNG